jgi:serine/threonine protein kinase
MEDASFFHGLFPMKIVQDIVSGLEYLHGKGMAHRDLKLLNVLVTNRNYIDLAPDSVEFLDQIKKKPITCHKLTDFGESRSEMIQTCTILNAQTRNLERGTIPYLAPETLVPSLKLLTACLADLLNIDIWALGMTMFNILNPDAVYPFQREFRSSFYCRVFAS